ncbi:endolytic transglycosylase MltG [Sphaerisporangium sp. TRM90804]|uniref:endolytic transglycosylase MltG n=1 Tax=Sphaerisporangium sp. TRM90804 TaxID=3031113 RepID=UPI00244921F3|nr:endolytic transglycosylase MltG [Sphaerisporangium sp. TRM90804]MDH2427407.1 endolytic transglycosylase MltG [Sphaerisporangium sp. TRM90804]
MDVPGGEGPPQGTAAPEPEGGFARPEGPVDVPGGEGPPQGTAAPPEREGGFDRPEGPPEGPDAPPEPEGDSGGLISFAEEPRDASVAGRREAARRGRRRAVLLVAAGSAVLVTLGLTAALTLFRPLVAPEDFDGPGSGPAVVEIAPGASAGAIGDVLVGAGVVASTRAFVREVERRGKAGGLRPGRYLLRKRMSAGSAVDLLLAPRSRIRKRVTLPEGLRASEVVARLARGSGLPAKDLSALAAAPAGLGLPAYAGGAVEGYLFPATYDIEQRTTARDLMSALVRRFKRAAADLDLEAGAARHRLSRHQIVVVASIVQAEGGGEADYPKIARVIYNRLAAGAKLEMDSTVMYGLGKHGIVASNAEIKKDTPYNTYMHRGLPAGPIGNPGEAALRAALHPAKGAWNWFVTVDPKRRITKFTDKESEFVKFREELNRRLGQQ